MAAQCAERVSGKRVVFPSRIAAERLALAQLHSGRLIEERREAGKIDEAQMGLPAAARVPPENASLTQDLQNGVAQQCGRW